MWPLDAFGGYHEPEGVREADHGGGDRRPVSSVVRDGDEGLVNLQLCEWEQPQVAQRGVPGAEVVECQGNTRGHKISEHRQGVRVFVEEGALAEFEREPPRVETGGRENGADVFGQVTGLNRAGEMLTETASGGAQCWACRHAAASTQRSSAVISPVSSAIRRKMAGTSPLTHGFRSRVRGGS